MRLEVARDVAAPVARVWATLVDWERQPAWMLDAIAVEVLTPHRVGEGVVIRCPTRLLGLVVEDAMRVTEWEARRRLGVVHLGRVITGTGRFELTPLGAGATRVRWLEEVDPPLGALGERGAALVVPVLRAVFARSLGRLARLAEHDPSPVGEAGA